MILEGRNLARAVLAEGVVHPLLDGLTVEVRSEKAVGVTGPSGSGKTTLLRVLSGLEALSAGEVLVDGQVVTLHGWPMVRRRMVMVAQENPEMPGTPAELMEEALAFRAPLARGADCGTATEVVAALGMDGAVVDREWSSLSSGEARRVRIAIACALEPELLVLDEPSAGLDDESCLLMGRWLRTQVRNGLGVLVASHDEALLALVTDDLHVIYDGKIQASGSPVDIVPAAFARMREERER